MKYITVAILALSIWLSGPHHSATSADDTLELAREPLQPIHPFTDLDPAEVALGEKLFFDPRLSADNSTACVTCHDLSRGGADGLPLSEIPAGGGKTQFNTPTIFNVALNATLFWTGRFDSLEEHIHNEMLRDAAVRWSDVLTKLSADDHYIQEFSRVYDDGLTIANIQRAIVTFERSLTTPNSRFDRFLLGDRQALTKREQEGYRLFKDYGCVACHQGANVGGNMFQKLGIMEEFYTDEENLEPRNFGRELVTRDREDRHYFRVPSLRLAVLTAPYLHDGSVKKLDEMIKLMAKYQLGRAIPERDVELIIAFLATLPGEYRGNPLYRPEAAP